MCSLHRAAGKPAALETSLSQSLPKLVVTLNPERPRVVRSSCEKFQVGAVTASPSESRTGEGEAAPARQKCSLQGPLAPSF